MPNFKKRYLKFIHKLLEPFFNPLTIFLVFPRYITFIKNIWKYSRMEKAEDIKLLNIYPRLHEKTQTTDFYKHYFYQDIWAFQKILEKKVESHFDIGSRVDFVGFLSLITKVKFIDIRPIKTSLKNLESIKGDILSLPFKDNSIKSLSCLHVAEHIGLGRYGDRLDPLGTKKACQELSRVLAKNGDLYFSLPVGKPRLCFNAHRIHSPQQIIEYFEDLKLIEISVVDDRGNFIKDVNSDILADSNYACGLFWFKK